jgi:hypothetical protein
VNRLRRGIRGAYLARDLYAQRHAGDEARRADRAILGRGLPRPGRSGPAEAGRLRRNTGESPSIASGVGRVIAIRFASRTSSGRLSMSLPQFSVMSQASDSSNWYMSCQPPMRSSSAAAGRGSPLTVRISPNCSAMEASV